MCLVKCSDCAFYGNCKINLQDFDWECDCVFFKKYDPQKIYKMKYFEKRDDGRSCGYTITRDGDYEQYKTEHKY